MKKEMLEVARKNDISPAVADVFANKLEAEGYVLAKSPHKTSEGTTSTLTVQPAKPKG